MKRSREEEEISELIDVVYFDRLPIELVYRLLFESGLTVRQMIALRNANPSFRRMYNDDMFWDRIYALNFAPNEYNWEHLKGALADRFFIILALILRKKLRAHSMLFYLRERQNIVEIGCSANPVMITINFVAPNNFRFDFERYLYTKPSLFNPSMRLSGHISELQVIRFLYFLLFDGWKTLQRLIESRVPEY